MTALPRDDVPEIAFVRVLTAAGPYAVDDIVSVAFARPGVGRLAAHVPGSAADLPTSGDAVPETMSARVLRAAGPYGSGDVVTLAFLDPSIARIHAFHAVGSHEATDVAPVSPTSVSFAPTAAMPLENEERRASDGVRIRLSWHADRVARFVRVTERLLSVDRLGWYRHVFAMRLLVPDRVTCADETIAREAARHAEALRTATVETLGRPLLAAFMPSFAVTPEWLDSLDAPAAIRALASLRDVLAGAARDEDAVTPEELEPRWTIEALARAPLAPESDAPNVDALLPSFIATRSPHERLAGALHAYRSTLVELFGQAARAPERVRFARMAEPSHPLDDRLRDLARAVAETFGEEAVA